MHILERLKEAMKKVVTKWDSNCVSTTQSQTHYHTVSHNAKRSISEVEALMWCILLLSMTELQ